MICPKCKSKNTFRVTNTVESERGIHRRRRCTDCGHVGYTIELYPTQSIERESTLKLIAERSNTDGTK